MTKISPIKKIAKNKHLTKKQRKKRKSRQKKSQSKQELQKRPEKEFSSSPLFGIRQNKLFVLHTVVLNMLVPAVGDGSPEEVISRFKAMKTGDLGRYTALKSLFHNASKDIFGTWMPKIKFHSTPIALSSSTGVLNTVLGLRSGDLAYFPAMGGIFDEFKFAGPIEMVYRPTFEITTTGNTWPYAIGLVDFVDSNALVSISGSLFYDTAKVFLLAMPKSGEIITRWSERLLGNPDDVWMDTGLYTTYIAYFKTYNYLNVSGTVTYGYMDWEAQLEFRQAFGI